MASDNWPDSRDRLLEDIAKFSVQDAPAVSAAVPPKAAAPAARPQPAATAPPIPVAPVVPVAAVAATPSATAPPPLPMPPSSVLKPEASPPVTSNLLASLKQQALAKQQSENQKSAQQDEVLQRIHKALGMTYQYLHDLVELLNILKPPYAKV